MKPQVQGGNHGALNLVASDLFFGLGAVILVAVVVLSLNLREVVTRAMADRAATDTDTRQAAADLSAAISAPVLLADAQGLHRLVAGQRTTIPLADLWAAPGLDAWLGEAPLLVIAPQGQDAAFLLFSRAATVAPTPLPTLRLTRDCRALMPFAGGFQCQP